MENKNLWAALVKARLSAPAVAKAGYNQQGSFNYAPGDDVIEACRACLASHGLALVPVQMKLVEPAGKLGEGITTSKGVAGYGAAHATLAGDYVLGHESGETLPLHEETPVCPGPGRPADKALFAAQTEQLAYLYRGVLGAKRGDALDVSGRGDAFNEPEAPREPRRAMTVVRSQEPAPTTAPPATLVARISSAIDAAKTIADLGEVPALGRELGAPLWDPRDPACELCNRYRARYAALGNGGAS